MPVTFVNTDLSNIANGKPLDAQPVSSAFTATSTNLLALKTVVDQLLLGNVGENPTVTLNSQLTGSPTQNGGLVVNRGASADVSLRWNEGTDAWEFTNDGTVYTNLPTALSSALQQGLSRHPAGPAPELLTLSTIRFKEGLKALDSTSAEVIELPSTVTLSMATTGALGLDTGSVTSNTWYWPYLIKGEAGVSVVASTNALAPTLPANYTLYKRLPCPFRTFPSSTDIMPFVYTGMGTGTLTCLYSAAEYQITTTPATGANVCLSSGTASSATDVALTLVPDGATHALIAFSGRSAVSKIKPKNFAFEQTLAAAASTDVQIQGWVVLDGAKTYQYSTSANNTHHACLGFIINA